MFIRRRESLRWQNWIKCCLQKPGLSCIMFFGILEEMPGTVSLLTIGRYSVIPEQKLFTRVNNIGSWHLFIWNVSKVSCSNTLQCDGEIHFWTPSGCHCCVSFHFCVTVLHYKSYNVLFHRIKDNVLFMNCVHLKMKILSSFTHLCCFNFLLSVVRFILVHAIKVFRVQYCFGPHWLTFYEKKKKLGRSCFVFHRRKGQLWKNMRTE